MEPTKKAHMIPRTITTWQEKSWQDELSSLITTPEALFDMLELDPRLLSDARLAAKQFPFRTTLSYVSRVEKGNPQDPLLRQILPLGAELSSPEGYSNDPLGEKHTNPVPGIIHKYHGRALLIGTTQCAINCRYCFRRQFDYGANAPSRNQWLKSLDYLRNTPSIEEVILSGGDPLVSSDKQLEWLISELETIRTLRRLRIHSRLPIVLPSRITNELVRLLSSSRLTPVVVIHSNHANEIDESVGQALSQLRYAQITLLNQSVLLQGVNGNVNALKALSTRLFEYGVLPYYLHLLDKVQGAAHFAIENEQALGLYQSLLTQLPGYLVPKLVKEEAGKLSKTPIV